MRVFYCVLCRVSCLDPDPNVVPADAEVLNGLKWSQALDEAFRQNAGKDPDLLWQYFGSEVGYMRMFPGECAEIQIALLLQDVLLLARLQKEFWEMAA